MRDIMGTIMTVAAGAVALFIVLLVISSVQTSIPQDNFSVDNESWTVSLNTPVSLAHDDINPGSESVYNETSVLVPSSAYSMNYTAGTINATDSAYLPDGSAATITYTYQDYSSTTQTVMTNTNNAMILVGVGLIVVAATFILGTLFTGLWGGMGRRRGGR